MKKILGALIIVGLLWTAAWSAIFQTKTYSQQVLGASTSGTFTIDAPSPRDYPAIDYVVFFLKTASTSGTVTASVEMVDGTDVYNLPFHITSATATTAGGVASVSTTTVGTAGNYFIVVNLADFGGETIGPVRLKLATAAVSGVTANCKSSVYGE